MRRSVVSAALAAVVLACVGGTAEGAAVADASGAVIEEKVGQGTDACPEMSLCLYQDHDLNADAPAKVWVFPVAEERQDFTLRGHAAADQPSSAYMRAPGLGCAAYLFPDYACGFRSGSEAETVQFTGGSRIDRLNQAHGRAQRYGYFNVRGKWDTSKRWG